MISLRTRAYHPSIQFIGKRSLGKQYKHLTISLVDKSVGLNAPKKVQAPAAPQSTGPAKALSPQCEVRVDTDASRYSGLRLKLSKEEMDVINNGGQELAQVGDWRKIKYA